MPDLIHFCTEATLNMDGLYDDMRHLRLKHEVDIIHIEFIIINTNRAILSGTIWVTDGANGDLELGSLCVDYKIIEPFNL